MHFKLARTLLTVLALGTALAGCGGGSAAGPVEVRLGYFPNITQATALVGVARGTYSQELGSGARLSTSTFNAGPAAVEAIFSGALDLAYVGPNPAINAYAQSHGSAIRVISGASSGGASLVVRPAINSVGDLRGRKVASPQLGGTQDVALRYWLAQQGLKTTASGGGDVSILPQDNAQTLQTFRGGEIDGAWVPEPWATRLVNEGGGKVLVDERTLWPGGRFVTAQLVVRTAFLREHPEQVKAVLRAQVKTTDYLKSNPAESQRAANDQIKKVTGRALTPALIAAAWGQLEFTDDPVAASLFEDVKHAEKVGLLKSADVSGLYDLGMLNAILTGLGRPPVPQP
jgi:NitT/TauT family transport system substrate-binding protein